MWTRLCSTPNCLSAWLLCAATTTVAAAPVYECQINGQRVYSQQPGQNCRAADLSHSGFYTTTTPGAQAPTHTDSTPPPAGAETAAATPAHIQAAQAQLAQARRNLEVGRQVRYGNERNYAKYLARIAALEAEVQKSEAALQRLQNPQ